MPKKTYSFPYTNKIIHFTYNNTNGKDTDKLVVLVYNLQTRTTYYNRDFTVKKDNKAKIIFSSDWINKPLRLELTMINKSEKLSCCWYLSERNHITINIIRKLYLYL